jgi:hypothetical protein
MPHHTLRQTLAGVDSVCSATINRVTAAMTSVCAATTPARWPLLGVDGPAITPC